MDRRESIRRIAFLALGFFCGSPAGCKKPSKKPSRLSADDQKLIADIAETILPETDTPGAVSSGVDQFVMSALRDCLTPKERERFLSGLHEFESDCISRFGHSFSASDPTRKLVIVDELDREALGFWGKFRSKILRRNHFFTTLKRLCVIGYFTSHEGATKALSYDAMPGKWSGCLEIRPGNKGWAM